ncbi:HNH endonuclease [Kribbella qitaiheensis]|uniref:HNH endonuclease n=2 Tax=Kribbella qitaiheensis TaxID=1544730 RepID=A0A7G6WVT5_9ACTN|nr:HNH endonuclease [Kribbella qitaiheensis]
MAGRPGRGACGRRLQQRPALSAMRTDRLIICLAIAAFGILVLAAITGHERRRRDPMRFYSWPEKQLLIRQANGRCEHKPPFWRRCPAQGTQADHVVPWSRGGPTELWNGQLLCHRHNKRKSNRVPGPLYRWRLQRRRAKY